MRCIAEAAMMQKRRRTPIAALPAQNLHGVNEAGDLTDGSEREKPTSHHWTYVNTKPV